MSAELTITYVVQERQKVINKGGVKKEAHRTKKKKISEPANSNDIDFV